MRTIHKFGLYIEPKQAVGMPKWAEILSVQFQGEQLCLWAKVDTAEEIQFRTIEIFPTGGEILESDKTLDGPIIRRKHLATVQRGKLVWHVFERFPDR